MNREVWKYTMLPEAFQRVIIPRGAQFLSIQMQFEEIVLWALVDPDASRVTTAFELVGTGSGSVTPDARYLGTVQFGYMVWHFFTPKGTHLK